MEVTANGFTASLSALQSRRTMNRPSFGSLHVPRPGVAEDRCFETPFIVKISGPERRTFSEFVENWRITSRSPDVTPVCKRAGVREKKRLVTIAHEAT